MRSPDPHEKISWQDSLSTRFSLTVIVLVIIAILITGALLVLIASTTEEQSAYLIQTKDAGTISLMISGYISSALERVQVFAVGTSLYSHSPSDQNLLLTGFLIQHREAFSQFIVMDMNGTELTRVSRFHTYLPGELGDLADDPVFRQAAAGRISHSPIYLSAESGLLSMKTGMPIAKPTGELTGVLIAEMNCVPLWQKITGYYRDSAGYAYIVDDAGHLIAYHDISEVLNRYNEDLSQIPPVADFIVSRAAAKGGYRYDGFSGEPVVGVFSPVSGTDWAVVTELPQREAFAGMQEMLGYLVTILISCSILAGCVGFLMSDRLTRPVGDLASTALALGSGEWETEISYGDRSDEVGILSRSFTRMRDQLKDLYSDLQDQLRKLSLMQEEIRVSEEQYRTLFESNANALLLIGEDLTILLMNRVMEDLWGYTREEILGREKWTLLVADPQEMRRMMGFHHSRRIDGEETPGSYEFDLLTRSGEIRRVTASVTLIPGTTRSIATIIDITERRLVENALLQARKKLSLFNSITFNDIRSNVYVLAGFIDLKADEVTDPALLDWISRERECIQNINTTLLFAKDYQDMGLKPAIWQSVEQVYIYAVSHLDLSAVTRRLDVSGIEIYADPLLERVFYTLASNSITHGGEIFQISLTAVRSGDDLLLVHEDDGRGINADQKEQILEEQSTVKKGMNLFFSREILGITGITIRETGTEGRGARFEILVPRGMFRTGSFPTPAPEENR